MTGLVALVLLLGLIFINVPIGYALIVTAAIAMYFADIALITLPIQLFFGTNNFPLLAIPMFILMGELMIVTTISERLIALASALVGWIRGGLGHVNIVTSMFIAEMSGAATADAAAMSKIFVPGMQRAGYPKTYAAAVTATSATLGIIIPPSIPMVLFGVTTGTSIRDLFIGGIVPGLILGGAFMITNYIFARRDGYPKDAQFDVRRLGGAAKRASIPLLIPVVVVGGLIVGIFTPTEAAGIGVASALFFGMMVSKDLTVKGLVAVFGTTARQASIVMMLVAGSVVLGQYLANEQLPQKVVESFSTLTTDPILTLLLMNGFLLVVGMFLNAAAAVIVVVPIMMPLAASIGLDPVHFGLIVCLNLGIGQQTPPVASVLLTVCTITDLKIEQVLGYGKWFLLTMFIVLMIVSYIPSTVLWFRWFSG